MGISKYPPKELVKAYDILKSQHVPCLIYQDKYSMLVRDPEKDHMAINEKYGVGFIAFSPLAQGVLTNKYLHGIPETSRAHKSHGFLQESEITPDVIQKVAALNDLAQQRGQTLAEMALAWLLHNRQVTSVIVGTSSLNQLKDNLKAKENAEFSAEEMNLIEKILG
ncbi:aryl-alcohol dehydrogenase-like predicted oxidoreductase [Dysgonomonas sp. PFB1-18]|nr:aryl-alcohol dehydrogenase-like predicted oxidoreductase [Dysgonomonas sp. PF1-14]MDH6337532.1 aryl-alcohol dehydrogenase-like predicted oxidoreductase [Dysgonomonas sp. PF1-16]MDH6378757.1 aryl-alcohol dehydrogenase-like predicted oxidoreductase [Dysgonomonas sp. PFB1-18]MDH6399175.1 aryl-alcohol dehydrogenase-like predicted oxidoreductase [Dysgonomonas sp. PF1-23]